MNILLCFLFNRETTADSSKLSNSTLDQQSSLSSIEEKPLATRCTIPTSSNDNNNNNNNKFPIKKRHSTEASSTSIKSTSLKKPIATKPK